MPSQPRPQPLSHTTYCPPSPSKTTVCTIYNGAFDEASGQQRVIDAALAMWNDLILQAALNHDCPVIDLRWVCTSREDYTQQIEPSEQGGRKIAKALFRATLEPESSSTWIGPTGMKASNPEFGKGWEAVPRPLKLAVRVQFSGWSAQLSFPGNAPTDQDLTDQDADRAHIATHNPAITSASGRYDRRHPSRETVPIANLPTDFYAT